MDLKLASKVDIYWVWYASPDYHTKPTVGKFMTFGKGDISIDLQHLILDAIKQNVTPLVKHTNIESGFKNPNAKDDDWVVCWYSNDDTNSLKTLAKYLVDNNLVQKTKNGKLYNISFKYDSQTRNAEYGDSFTAKITLSDFLDLNTGELLDRKMSEKNIQLSEHFINFAIKGKKLDFNVFKTREEFDQYKEELEDFLKNPDSERFKDVFKYLKKNNKLKS